VHRDAQNTVLSQIPRALLKKNADQKLGCTAYLLTNIGDIFVFRYDDLPTVLAYPSNGKCVTSTCELSIPK
jgi:hypothetical protein